MALVPPWSWIHRDVASPCHHTDACVSPDLVLYERLRRPGSGFTETLAPPWFSVTPTHLHPFHTTQDDASVPTQPYNTPVPTWLVAPVVSAQRIYYIFINRVNHLSSLHGWSRLSYQRPDLLRLQRHIHRLDAQWSESIQHGIDDRGRRTDTACLAHAFHTQGIER